MTILEYVFSTARASTAPPYDHGVVAVIDGQSIKVTPFRTANIPPPMALHEFTVQSNAIDLAFNADASMISVLHQQGVSLFEWKSVAAAASGPALTARVSLHKTESPIGVYQQVSFAEKNDILVLQRTEAGSAVKRFVLNDDAGRMDEASTRDSPNSTISTLSSFIQDDSVHPFVQGRSGDLHSLAFGEQSLSRCNFPTYLPWVEIVPHGDYYIAFGMSNNGHLYANSRLLVKNCTSFLVTPAHLIFTTTTHLLKFVHIEDVNSTFPSPIITSSTDLSQILRYHQMTQKRTRDVAALSAVLDL
jgi:elongator complex protein 1